MKFDRRLRDDPPKGFGRVAAFLLLLVVAGSVVLIVREVRGGPPEVRLSRELKGVGRSTTVSVTATDQRGLHNLDITLEQGGVVIPIVNESYGSRWSFWTPAPKEFTKELQLGPAHQSDLKDGPATLRIRALNRKWVGGETLHDVPLVVRSRPPSIEIRSGLLYVNQAGSEMVLYKVSETAIESGVRVGRYFFPGHPLPGGQAGERVALFAYPHDLPPNSVAQVVARDDADNEALANFPHQVKMKAFRRRSIEVTDAFLQSTVPAILSNTPEIADQGDPLKNFLLLNGKVREMNRAKIAEIARQTAPRMLWEGPFQQLTNSAVESQFADYRTYMYQGKKVDEQVHLGFDLASLQQAPVVASNAGKAVFAEYLGIFGNTIIVDHGLGLQSLYAHLSAFRVKPGDMVRKGQVMGTTGSTGMAGGDHLHFTTLLAGVEVNPIEWWDPLWVRQHILEKLSSPAPQ